MQKINYHIIISLVLSVLAVSCGGSDTSVEATIAEGNMENIRGLRTKLTVQQKTLEDQISLLDSAIAANTENSNLPLVTTFVLQAQEFYHFVELQGDVTTQQNVLVYPEVAGALVQIHVKEGDRVKKGQLLATIDNGGLNNQLLQMETQLQLAETTYDRQKRLWDQKIGSEIQFLQAKTTFQAQKNAVDQMKQQLDKFYLRAPFSGIVDDLMKDPGTVVSPGPGSEVFRIINLSDMYIEVLVPEKYIPSVVPGKKVMVSFPVLGSSLETSVRETGNYINPNNRSFTVKIPVPNKDGQIKPNLTAKVKINDYYNEQAFLIPQSIVSENADGEQYVYVVKNITKEGIAKAERAIITTGKTQEGSVEVLSGISNGNNIIMEGARSVKDGQQVKILTK